MTGRPVCITFSSRADPVVPLAEKALSKRFAHVVSLIGQLLTPCALGTQDVNYVKTERCFGGYEQPNTVVGRKCGSFAS